MWTIVKKDELNWVVWDGLGCEISVSSDNDAHKISDYFNENDISGKGLINTHIEKALENTKSLDNFNHV